MAASSRRLTAMSFATSAASGACAWCSIADAVTLDLPAGRSLIHCPPSQHLTVPYADIAAVETRLEAYGSFGMEMMQRAYVLRRNSGELIFLFEDRALATGMRSAFFPEIAAELAARAGVALQDLGMVEGSGGFLGVWGAHVVDWGAPSLPLARQLRLWRHAAIDRQPGDRHRHRRHCDTLSALALGNSHVPSRAPPTLSARSRAGLRSAATASPLSLPEKARSAVSASNDPAIHEAGRRVRPIGRFAESNLIMDARAKPRMAGEVDAAHRPRRARTFQADGPGRQERINAALGRQGGSRLSS